MRKFIETIKIKDGNYMLLDYHNKRLNDTVKCFFDKHGGYADLKNILPDPAEYSNGVYKCRVVYSDCIEKIDITSYVPKNIKSLRLLTPEKASGNMKQCRVIHYEFKYEDRACLDLFKSSLGKDEEPLFVINGLITDTSYSNIIFFDGIKWWTPDTYLLNGVKRRYLLENAIIWEKKIQESELCCFQKASLINAMLEPGDIELEIAEIY